MQMRFRAICVGVPLLSALIVSAWAQAAGGSQDLPPSPDATRTLQTLRDPGVPKATQGGAPDAQPDTPDTPPNNLLPGAEILSDTQGVDFAPYMRKLHDDIQRNWTPLIPREVNPPESKKGVVGIRFSILPDGSIGSMRLETRSGDVALDRAAWDAITNESKFPPLPQEFHGPDLELRTGFFYNTPIVQKSDLPSAPAPSDTAVQPKKIGGAVKSPILIYAVEPAFSEAAQKYKIKGTIKVSLWVDENGKPSHVHVLPGQGLGYGLDDLAVEAVKQYKFKPAVEDGKPVTVEMTVEVNFQIY